MEQAQERAETGTPRTQDSVTVVIPFYGDPSDTEQLIATLRQDGPACLRQIIVVDDASPVPFPESVQGDPGSLPVLVVRRPVNGGFGSAVNSGLEQVQTPLAVVLNSDIEITGADLDALVEQAMPWQPVVASPQVVNHDGTPQWSGRHFPTVLHQAVEWLTPLARFRHLPVLHEAVGHDVAASQASEPTPVDWVMGAVMLLPMDQVRAVGGFDEDFHMNSEEVDLQRRLREHGVASMVFPSITVPHAGGGSSDPLKRRQWLVDSRAHYARKWGHPRVLKGSLVAATGVNFAVNTVRQLMGTDVDARAVLRQELELLR